ncbi:MAG: RNA polymerase subunit sigma-70 [Flavobacterium psychrophilum]|nr:MAG: RNA polymerase subunit sigma-70 [Flavobacterium psychrophilum]
MNLEQIIKGCRNYNRGSQEELYHLYKGVLFSLCLKYCPNEAEAEDNLHNAFIEIFTTIDKFKGTGSFEGWMKRITINKAINGFKKTKQLTPIKDNFTGDTDVGEEEMNIPADMILEMVQQLPDQYRLVFCLYELDDYPHKEIAVMLSISESTSKSNLHRAKAILKEKITALKNAEHTQSHGS